MRKLSAASIILLGLANAALAQTVTNPQPNAGNYGAYNLVLPTCTTGLGCWLQTDINGRLIVVGAGGSAGSVTQGTVPWVVSGQGTAGTAATGVVTVQGIAAMTPFLTTTTLNAETTKVIGTVNQGTSPWVVSGTVTLGANQSVNTAQVNGVTTLTGTGAVGTGTQRVAIGTDTATIAGSAPGTASTASANVITVQTPSVDPCKGVVATYTPISMTTATTTRIIAPVSAKRTYICYMYISTGIANNVAIIEGTGGTCGTGTAGVVGGTTAANGVNMAANGGSVFNGGGGTAIATTGTNVDFCLITSAAGPLAGHVKWVQAP